MALCAVGVMPEDISPFFYCGAREYGGFEAELARLVVAAEIYR